MFDFVITPDGGESYELTADSRDVYMWERTTRGASIHKLKRDLQMGDLYQIAHRAAKRQGRFEGTADQFVETHVLEFDEPEVDGTRLLSLVEQWEGGDLDADDAMSAIADALKTASQVDPTRPGRSPGTSSRSRSPRTSR
jgi:hypothetical protein